MSVFGAGLRPWKRQTEAKRAADTSVPGKGELVVSDAGKVYVPDGTTQAKNLSPLVSKIVADATYALLWQPNTAYAANAPVMLPNGKTATRTSAGTSRPSFDATELAAWTIASGGSGSSAWADITGKPAVIGAGADAVSARATIEAASLWAGRTPASTPMPTRRTAFAGKPNGAPASTDDTGQSVIASGGNTSGAPIISGGKFTTQIAGTGQKYAYREFQEAQPVTRVGCRFTFDSQSGARTGKDSSVVCAISAGKIADYATIGVHLVIKQDRWSLTSLSFSPYSYDIIFEDFFETPLVADGATVYEVEVFREGRLLVVRLPDGSIISYSSPLFASRSGVWGFHETTFEHVESEIIPAITECWADSRKVMADVSLLPTRAGGYESTGVRRARTQLSAAATGGFGFLNNNWVFRLPFLPTVDVTQFSVTFANRWTGDPFNAAGNGTGVVTVNSVWIGQAALDANGQPNGQFVAGTAQQVSTALTVPTNGSDIATAWVTNYPLTAGKLYLISYGCTQDGANYAEGSNICWFAGTAANAGQNAPSGLAPYMGSTLDVRIDYRHGTEPSGLWIGPSIMQGLSNGLLNGSLVGGAWGWLNYPTRTSQARKHAAQVMAVKSSQYGDFTSGAGWRWVRAAIASQNIDYVVIGECGTNNAIASTALATSIANLRSILTYVRAQLPGRPIYLCTNTPSSTLPSGKLTTAIAANGTSVASDTDLGASGVAIRVGVGLQAETRTTSAKSGSGPWTYTVPALTYAHPIGERVQGPQDLIRQTINDMIIAGQFDCDGVIDLCAAVADPTKPQQQSLDVVDKDWIHTTPVGQVRLRDAALAAIAP